MSTTADTPHVDTTRAGGENPNRELLIAVVAAVIALLFAGGIGVAAVSERARIGSPVQADALPAAVGDWSQPQLAVAAKVIEVAQDRGISTRGQEIAVMVAMGESSLRNIGFGDDALNPDGTVSCSLGIYQQQWCLEDAGWGSKEQVMNPKHATGAFLDRMVQVPDWEHKPATLVGYQVQQNTDAYHYADYFDDAQLVVALLTDTAPAS